MNHNTLEWALSVLSSDSESDSKVLYDCAILLDESSVKDKSFDPEAKSAFEKCLEHQSYVNDGVDFLDSCRRYIRLLLKYKEWKQSWNFLQLYDALTSSEEYSIWYLCAKVKVEYELHPDKSFVEPYYIIQELNRAFSIPGDKLQVESVLKEFESKAEDYFYTDVKGFKGLEVFTNEVRKNILRSSSKTEVGETSNIVSSDVGDYDYEALKNQISFLQHQLQAVQYKSDELISDNIALSEQVESLKQPGSQKVVDNIISDPFLSKTNRKLRILVLGAGPFKAKDFYGIARTLNLHKDNFDLHLDYSKNKRFSLDAIRWNSTYSGILIGPIAHKIVDLGSFTSPLQKLREEGYPPVSEIRQKSGNLKLTKTSLRSAIESLLNKIQTTDPDIIPNQL